MVQSYVNTLHRMPPLLCLYMNDSRSPRLYYKVARIHNFSKYSAQPLFIYYRLFRLYILELDPRLCLHIKFKFIQKYLDSSFST